MMPEIPVSTFIQACNDVVKDNIAYVPPYGSGGALYLRPLLFGSGPRIGLQPSEEYTFLIMVIPVGDYYHGGLAKPVSGLIVDEYPRRQGRGKLRRRPHPEHGSEEEGVPHLPVPRRGVPHVGGGVQHEQLHRDRQ